MMLGDKDLKKKALAGIERSPSDALSSDDFTRLSKEALHEVLQQNMLITNELDVFRASMLWAVKKMSGSKHVQ